MIFIATAWQCHWFWFHFTFSSDLSLWTASLILDILLRQPNPSTFDISDTWNTIFRIKCRQILWAACPIEMTLYRKEVHNWSNDSEAFLSHTNSLDFLWEMGNVYTVAELKSPSHATLWSREHADWHMGQQLPEYIVTVVRKGTMRQFLVVPLMFSEQPVRL